MTVRAGWRERASVMIVVLTIAMVAGCRNAPRGGSDDPAWASLDWLAGTWVGRDRAGVETEEHWTTPRGDAMLGVNRTIGDGRLVFFEFLRIARDDLGFVYYASPRGRFPPTPFRLVPTAGDELVFENAAHDYPQRIIYTPIGVDELSQRIEGEEDGEPRSSSWELRRVR